MKRKTNVGIAGSGYIAKGLFMALERHPDFNVTVVLTRTNIKERSDFPREDLLTNSVNELIDKSEIIVECSGDVIHATEVIDEVLSASLPVVTLDAEFHVTTGSYFIGKGLVTEAEGDQPGCHAALAMDAVDMGFKPLVYGNIKGFLNHNPTIEEMEFWSKKQNIALSKCISFTDGTKIQIEQALVANGLGADISMPGLAGPAVDDLQIGAGILIEHAERLKRPVSDYVLSAKMPPGIFIVAEHDERQKLYLRNYKLGDGPYYILLRNYHLCHLEVAKTLNSVLSSRKILLNNSVSPSISVAAIAKKEIKQGTIIDYGIGSFDVRGIAVRIKESRNHIPIGLLADARVKRDIAPGQQLCFDDVEIQDTLALRAWREILNTL